MKVSRRSRKIKSGIFRQISWMPTKIIQSYWHPVVLFYIITFWRVDAFPIQSRQPSFRSCTSMYNRWQGYSVITTFHNLVIRWIKNYRKNIIQVHTFASSFSKAEARSTIAPLTAYSICFTNGFIVSPVRLLSLEHFPLAKENEWSCTDLIKDRLLNKLGRRWEAITFLQLHSNQM